MNQPHNRFGLAALLTCMLAIVSFPVTEINSAGYQNAYNQIKNASPNGDEMLLDGKAPLPGQYLKLPNLGKTFREVAEKGKDGFYKGRVAQAIVDLIQSNGGVMSLEDLANHSTDFVEPIKYTFNEEVTVYEVIPLVPTFNLNKSSRMKRVHSARPMDRVSPPCSRWDFWTISRSKERSAPYWKWNTTLRSTSIFLSSLCGASCR